LAVKLAGPPVAEAPPDDADAVAEYAPLCVGLYDQTATPAALVITVFVAVPPGLLIRKLTVAPLTGTPPFFVTVA
jgi:hypothetical protein